MLIPTKKQFLGWTMPTRVGYLAAIATFITFAIQIPDWGYRVYSWLQDAPPKLSAADKLVIDQNPTKVTITGVSKKPVGPNKEAVFLTLTNNSKVTARNVRVYLYNHLGTRVSTAEPFTNGMEGSGVSIHAGESRQYRLSDVSDYENLFNPETPGASLLRVSTQVQDEAPFELATLACGVDQWGVRPCEFDSTGLSTIVNLRYGSIFGQKYNVLTQFYNTFLKGEVRYLPDRLNSVTRR